MPVQSFRVSGFPLVEGAQEDRKGRQEPGRPNQAGGTEEVVKRGGPRFGWAIGTRWQQTLCWYEYEYS